jgi:hypothetical protein
MRKEEFCKCHANKMENTINTRHANSLAQYGQQELLKQHENLEWKYIRKGKYNMNKNLE